MLTLNPKIDLYLSDGCGRCKYHATPRCKVKKWQVELQTLRQIALESELTEDLKWGTPVYTFNDKNVINIVAFKDYCCIGFFKGALLKDTYNLLQKHGESSQSVRTLKFTDTNQIMNILEHIKSYIVEAIELEKSGAKVTFKKNLEPVPEELENIFIELPVFKTAFYALTPGKQRAYIIYFSQPKQSETRISRIEKCKEKIMNGEGLNDKYKC